MRTCLALTSAVGGALLAALLTVPGASAAPPSQACIDAQTALSNANNALVAANNVLTADQAAGVPNTKIIQDNAAISNAQAAVDQAKAAVAAQCDTPTPTPTPTPTTTPPPVVIPPSGTTPVARDDNYNTPVNINLVIGGPGLLNNDSDADGDPLSSALVAGAQHGNVNVNGNGAFTYVPTTNYTGPDQFTYKACDPSGKCDAATVFINVGGTVSTVPPPVGGPRPIYQSCQVAFAAGVHDIPRSDPRYRIALDPNRNGIACERNGADGVTPPATIVRPPANTTIINPPAAPNTVIAPAPSFSNPGPVIVLPPPSSGTFTNPVVPSGPVATGDGTLAYDR